MNIFETDEFAVEVVSKGAFIDKVTSHHGDSIFLIETAVIRLSPKALNMWLEGNHLSNDRDCYDTEEEYQAYVSKKKAVKEECDELIKKALGFDGHCTITQNVSEIFTVVKIRKSLERSGYETNNS